MTRPTIRRLPASASCWASARVFTIRANQRNLSILRVSGTRRALARQSGEGMGGIGPALLAAALLAAPHPRHLGTAGAETEIPHQPRDRFRSEAERSRKRVVDHR